MDARGQLDAAALLKGVMANTGGADGAVAREAFLERAPLGWLQDFADSVHVLDQVLGRVLAKRMASCR